MKLWSDRIEASKRYQKKSGREEWKKYVDVYKSASAGSSSDEESRLRINLMKTAIKTIRAATYFQNPRVLIEPQDPDSDALEVNGGVIDAEEQAKLIEKIDNSLIKKIGLKHEMKRAIVDAHLTPLGIIKVFHEATTVSSAEGVEQVTAEKYGARRVSPFRFFVDPGADAFDLNRCTYVAELKLLSREDVKRAVEEDNYKKSVADKLNYTELAFMDKNEADIVGGIDNKADMKDAFRRAKVWEVHSLETGKLIEFEDGADDFLRNDDHPYSIDGYIYEVLGFDETPDDFYPIPYAKDLLALNYWITRLARYFIRHAGRQAARKGLYDKSVLKGMDVQRIVSGDDGYLHPAEPGLNKKLSDAIHILPSADAPRDVWEIFNIMFGPVWREISGIDDMLRGGVIQGASPTEAQAVREGTSLSLNERRDAVEDFARRIVRKLNGLQRQFQTTKEAVQLAGPSGIYWVRWNKDDIQGNYTENIEVYSAQPFDMTTDRKQSIDLANFLYGRPEVNNVELIDGLRKKFRLSEKVVRNIGDQGPKGPLYENVMVLHGQPLIVHPAEDHGDHIRQHTAFLESYQAQLPVGVVQTLTQHIQQHHLMEQQIGNPQQQIGTAGQPQQVPGAVGADGTTAQQQLNAPVQEGPQPPGQDLAAVLGGLTGGPVQ